MNEAVGLAMAHPPRRGRLGPLAGGRVAVDGFYEVVGPAERRIDAGPVGALHLVRQRVVRRAEDRHLGQRHLADPLDRAVGGVGVLGGEVDPEHAHHEGTSRPRGSRP